MSILNKNLVDVVSEIDKSKRIEALLNYTKSKIVQKLSENDFFLLKNKLCNFLKIFEKKWKNCKRMKNRFESLNHSWLNCVFDLPFLISDKPRVEKIKKLPKGRPKKSFSNLSARGMLYRTSKFSDLAENNYIVLLRCASLAANRQKKFKLAQDILYLIDNRKRTNLNLTKYQKVDPVEALAFLLKNEFSKAQYCDIKSKCKSAGVDLWPCYKVVASKKRECRPDGIVISDFTAQVPLQNLLNHTAKRLVESQCDELKELVVNKG